MSGKANKPKKNSNRVTLCVPVRCAGCGYVYFHLSRAFDLPYGLTPTEIVWATDEMHDRLGNAVVFNNRIASTVCDVRSDADNDCVIFLCGVLALPDVSEETLALIATMAKDDDIVVNQVGGNSLAEAYELHQIQEKENAEAAEYDDDYDEYVDDDERRDEDKE
jgi:hypothetical protein